MPTTATSHRSRATLLQVAQSHASSRALSGETREVFQHIVNGETFTSMTDPCEGLSYSLSHLADAFFEAATSCATRAGQSYSRRVMCSDLMALRDAFYAGQSVKPSEYYLNVTVVGATPADVDAFERALRAFEHAGVTVTEVEGV